MRFPALFRRSSRLAGVAWLAGAAALLLAFIHGAAMIAFPLQVDYAEGVVLHLTDALAHGRDLYPDPGTYPWMVSPYTPLFMKLATWLGPCFDGGFGAGRTIAFLSALGCAAIVGWAAGRRADDNGAGLTAAAIFVGAPLFVGWSAMDRVDFLALFFELLGLYGVDRCLVDAGPASGRRRASVVAAAACFALAFWSKQSFVLGFLAAVIAVGWRRRAEAAALCAATAAFVAVPFAVLDLLEGGRLVSLFFKFNAMPWSGAQAWLWTSAYLPTIVLAALLAAAGFAARPGPHRLWALYFALTVLTLAGVGRTGAYYNYFLPFQAATAIGAGLAAWAWGSRSRGWRRLAGAVVLAQVAFAGIRLPLPPTLPAVAHYAAYVPAALDGRLLHRAVDGYEEIQAGRTQLLRYPGPLLAENLGLPVLIGRPVAACDPITLFTLAKRGLWDERPLLRMIRERRFGAILLQELSDRNLRFPVHVLEAIRANYALTGIRIEADHVLAPRENRDRHHFSQNGCRSLFSLDVGGSDQSGSRAASGGTSGTGCGSFSASTPNSRSASRTSRGTPSNGSG